MNLYFLLEGKRTEVKIYPKILSHFLPEYTRVKTPQEVDTDNYYMISGEGYPRLLDVQLANSVKDVNDAKKFDCLIVCLDADESTIEDRKTEITSFIAKNKIKIIDSCKLIIIVQNRCFETWFLGNKRIISRVPSVEVRDYVNFYNVSSLDPEAMGFDTDADYDTHAQYHHDYLKTALQAKNVRYTKQNPSHVGDTAYLNQLQNRIDTDGHIKSFKYLIDFLEEVRNS